MKRMAPIGACMAAFLAAGCGDPVLDRRVEALGDEAPGVPRGEYHRPGQPCLLCHSDEGSARRFTVAGTIYGSPTSTSDKNPDNDVARPVAGVKVTLTDSFGKTFSKTTNCIGNFFVRPEEFDPDFPLRAEIEYPMPGAVTVTKRNVMATRISRDGSCAGCHSGDRSQKGPGRVFCSDDPAVQFPPPADDCPGVPR